MDRILKEEQFNTKNRFVFFRTAVNEVQNLHYLPRTSAPRESLAEDRTPCHADHIGHGFDRSTTAAVAVLKAVHPAEDSGYVMFTIDMRSL